MSQPCLTLAELNKLRPCADDARRVRALLKKASGDKAHCFSAAEARDAGCTFDDIVWVASALARSDKAVERKLRLWMSDCAARVLHIYEGDYPTDDRPRNAIKASRDFANGKIGAAWTAGAAEAAGAAWTAGAAEAAWAARAAGAAEAAGAAWAARAAEAAWAAEAAEAAEAAGAAEAAWAARAAGAAEAAEAAEEQWQFDRLIIWLSDDEPKPLRLPARPKIEARRKAA